MNAGPPTLPGKILTISAPHSSAAEIFRGRRAARQIGNLAAVAQPRHFGVEARAHHEAGARGDEQRRRRRIDHRADHRDWARVPQGRLLGQLLKHAQGAGAAIGELHRRRTAIHQRSGHRARHRGVAVVEQRQPAPLGQ